MGICSEDVKGISAKYGADLCGIASIDRFTTAPRGYHPCDILPSCKSVVVVACEFPRSSLSDPKNYTQVRNQLVKKLDNMASLISKELKSRGTAAVAKRSIGPCEWDEDDRYRDDMSLIYAGVYAGLGKIGKNNLLINNKYGNMIWCSAVLTSEKLEADPLAEYEVCAKNCKICINSCPVGAIDGKLIKQLTCYDNAYTYRGGRQQIICWKCRTVCPNCFGIK
ncbi:MAG: epoxyqueuosine reductase [Clostridia bacterium]|nr:epoxyqueuosine reductase [Clostridia bacterium]